MSMKHIMNQRLMILETVSNPFESSESIFMSVSIGKKKNRLNKHQDKNHEIAKEIKSMDLIL